MKNKTTTFNRNRVGPRIERVKKAGARWLLRHSAIFARVHEHSHRKKGKIFAMKARLTRFYLDHIAPRIVALKAKTSQLKQWLAGRWAAAKAKASDAKQQGRRWLARRRHSLGLAAVAIIFLVVGAGLALMWQRSPVLRAAVKTLGVAVASGLVTLLALLKGLGLTLREGLTGLARGLAGLSRGVLKFLRLLGSRLTRPVIKVVIVPRPTGESIPVPPVDGRL